MSTALDLAESASNFEQVVEEGFAEARQGAVIVVEARGLRASSISTAACSAARPQRTERTRPPRSDLAKVRKLSRADRAR
jgi:hypothetical protein